MFVQFPEMNTGSLSSLSSSRSWVCWAMMAENADSSHGSDEAQPARNWKRILLTSSADVSAVGVNCHRGCRKITCGKVLQAHGRGIVS